MTWWPHGRPGSHLPWKQSWRAERKGVPAGPGEPGPPPYGGTGAVHARARPAWGHTREGEVTGCEGCGQRPDTSLAKVTQTCLTPCSEQPLLSCPGSPAPVASILGSSSWVACRTLFRVCTGSLSPSTPPHSPSSQPGAPACPSRLSLSALSPCGPHAPPCTPVSCE